MLICNISPSAVFGDQRIGTIEISFDYETPEFPTCHSRANAAAEKCRESSAHCRRQFLFYARTIYGQFDNVTGIANITKHLE